MQLITRQFLFIWFILIIGIVFLIGQPWFSALFAQEKTQNNLQSQEYSIRFYGNGIKAPDRDRVKIVLDNPHRPVDVGETDFTIEFRMRANAVDNPSNPCMQGASNWINGNTIIDRDNYGQGDYGDYGISLYGGSIAFGVSQNDIANTICGTINVADNIWHHIAVTRNTSTGQLRIFVDGRPDGQGYGPIGNISYRDGRETSWLNSDPFLVIGAEKHDAGSNFPSYNGFIDELRLSNVIRYNAAFVPQTSPFTTDVNTVALYHFNEGSGDIIYESSGAANEPSHGVVRFGGEAIAGPVWSLNTPWNPSPPLSPTPIGTTSSLPTATPTERPTPISNPTVTLTPSQQTTPTVTPTPTQPDSLTPTPNTQPKLPPQLSPTVIIKQYHLYLPFIYSNSK